MRRARAAATIGLLTLTGCTAAYDSILESTAAAHHAPTPTMNRCAENGEHATIRRADNAYAFTSEEQRVLAGPDEHGDLMLFYEERGALRKATFIPYDIHPGGIIRMGCQLALRGWSGVSQDVEELLDLVTVYDLDAGHPITEYLRPDLERRAAKLESGIE